MKKDSIKIKGYCGKWHVVDETIWNAKKLYLLEHDTFGDATACLIVNEELEVVLDDVWNGFLDLEDL